MAIHQSQMPQTVVAIKVISPETERRPKLSLINT